MIYENITAQSKQAPLHLAQFFFTSSGARQYHLWDSVSGIWKNDLFGSLCGMCYLGDQS